MANKHETLTGLFTDIADAIRSKTGGSESLIADNFPSAIATIETGIDTSDADATATDIARGKTAYVNGEKVTGDLYEVTSGSSILTDGEINSVVDDSLRIVSNSMASNRIFRTGSKIRIDVPLRDLGDADASNVQSGKTFTSSAGLKVTGTYVPPEDALFLKAKNAYLFRSNSDPRINYCNDRFIVSEDRSSYIQYSYDGMSWTAVSTPAGSAGFVGNAYGYGGNYIITYNQGSGYWYTDDMMGWSSGTFPFTSYAPVPIAYDGSRYVTVSAGTSNGSNVAAYSYNLSNWSTVTLPTTLRWMDVAYGNGKFVAVGHAYASYNATATNKYAYSSNALDWSSGTLPSSAVWSYVTFGNGKFVAITNSGDQVACSPDGLTWTLSTLPLATTWRKVVYGNGVYIATPYNSSTYAYSYDGTTWHQGSLPASTSWLSIAFGDGKFIAIASSSFVVAISYNGVDWDTKTDFIADTSDKNVTRETVLAVDEFDTARFLTDVEEYETVPVVVEQETSHNTDMSVESCSVTGTYLVTVDGVEYVCNLYSDDQSAMSLGDSRLERSDMSNPVDVPFKAVFWYDETWGGDSELLCYFAFPDAGTHTVEIGRITGTVKKAALLDKKGADVTSSVLQSVLPALSNPATADEIIAGYEAIDNKGNKLTGTAQKGFEQFMQTIAATGTFTVPATGRYRVTAIGAGSAATYKYQTTTWLVGTCGGGGYVEMDMAEGETYQITINGYAQFADANGNVLLNATAATAPSMYNGDGKSGTVSGISGVVAFASNGISGQKDIIPPPCYDNPIYTSKGGERGYSSTYTTNTNSYSQPTETGGAGLFGGDGGTGGGAYGASNDLNCKFSEPGGSGGLGAGSGGAGYGGGHSTPGGGSSPNCNPGGGGGGGYGGGGGKSSSTYYYYSMERYVHGNGGQGGAACIFIHRIG